MFSACFLCVFSVCVFMLCFLSVFSPLCFLLSVFFLSSLCFQYVLSVCVFCPCFLSGFAFLSINFDIILLWSGLADQLLFADINSQLIWLQYKYKILTRYCGLSGSPASSIFHQWNGMNPESMTGIMRWFMKSSFQLAIIPSQIPWKCLWDLKLPQFSIVHGETCDL